MKVLRVLVCIFFLYPGILHAQEETAKLNVLYSDLDKPTSIYATQQHLFVVESGKHRILKLDHSGELLETLGGLGNGDYQFDTPVDIDATNGLKIYVSDYRNNRIQVFDRRFQFLSSIRRDQSLRSSRPTQIAVNKFGELFYYDESSKSIISINEQGSQLDEFPLPDGIQNVLDVQLMSRNLYILDLEQEMYHELSDNGLQLRSYPLDEAVQFFKDKNGEEWLFESSLVRNPKNSDNPTYYTEELEIRDVVKFEDVFFVLAKNSIIKISIEN